MNDLMKSAAIMWACIMAVAIALPGGVDAAKAEPYDFMQLYRAFAQARIGGDIDTWRMLLVSEKLERIEAMYANRGMEIAPRDIKPKKTVLLTRFQEFPVIKRTVATDTARLVLWNDIVVENENYELVIIMFHMEDGRWKIGQFGSVMIDRTKLKRDMSFPEAELPEFYQLEDMN